MQIKEYRILRGYLDEANSDEEERLSYLVNKAIAEGWEPLGGLGGVPEHWGKLAQAMVRRG